MAIKRRRNKASFYEFIGIGVISASLFMYEIVISRVLSTMLPYHYVFLILSTAVLGMAVGSMMEFYRQKDREKTSSARDMGSMTLQLAISMIICFSFIYFKSFIRIYLIYVIISGIPYVFAGRLFTRAFSLYSESSNKIYFFDLVGAGVGAIISIVLFQLLGFINSISFVFILSLISVILFSIPFRKKKAIGVSLGFIVLLLSTFFPTVKQFIAKNHRGYLTSTQTLIGRLREENKGANIIYTDWNGFARTDVIQIEDNDIRRIVTTNGASNAAMVRYDGKQDLAELKREIDYAPYLISKDAEVAIIGAGGGRDVLQALLAKAKKIDAIEINGSTVKAVKAMGDFNGDIYNDPRVNVIVGDGRSVITQNNKKYDIIFLSMVMTGAAQANGYALAENYIYTEEALDQYYKHLKPNGKLVFVGHDEEDMIKLSNTAIQVLQKNSIAMNLVQDYILLGGNTGNHETIHTPIIMVKNAPYSVEEVDELKKFFKDNQYNLFHIPRENNKTYINLISKGLLELEEVLQNSKVNISPATDEKPFFYNYQKGIPYVFILIILSTFTILMLYFRVPVRKQGVEKQSLYFSMLGMAYMMVEVAFIQKMTFYLEHPTAAFVITLSSLLVGSGIGSFLSFHGYWHKKQRHLAALGAGIALIMTAVVLKTVIYDFYFIEMWQKIITAILLIGVNGFFMGMLFPFGIKRLRQQDNLEAIPLVYGMNGVFSVIGSVTGMIIAMQWGITNVILISAGVYLFIFLAMPLLLGARSCELEERLPRYALNDMNL